MPEQQHHPKDIQTYGKGINADADAEFPREGNFLDSQNMRPATVDGHSGAINKIHGEVIKYPNIDNRCTGGSGNPFPSSYQCTGTYNVLNHLIEFWCDASGVGVSFVRIDGWVVLYPNLQSEFPITVNNPLQLHGNDSCVGGEIFCTDNVIPPFSFNISDLLQNSGINPANNLRDGTYPCTQKYFSSFNISQYTVQQPIDLSHPVFIEICTPNSTPNAVGTVVTQAGAGGGGMKVGAYQYFIQYSDLSGNTTNFTEGTPQINLPYGYQNFSVGLNPAGISPTFTGVQAYGNSAGSIGAATFSSGAIHIRFRVNNINNLDHINVRRLSWTSSQPVDSQPSDDSIIKEIQLTNGESTIIDFYDFDNFSLTPTPQEAVTDQLSAIQSAKTLRYYSSRLTLMNITYQSRDLSSQVQFLSTSSGNKMFPISRSINSAQLGATFLNSEGYNDIWNQTYRRSFMRGGEQYGIAIVFFDTDANASFALQVPQNSGVFTTPNRRDALTSVDTLSQQYSYDTDGTPLWKKPFLTAAVNSSDTAVSQTFEVFDLVNAGGKDLSTGSGGNPDVKNILDCSICSKSGYSGNASNYYEIFRPINNNVGGSLDTSGQSTRDLTYQINTKVNDGSTNFSYNPQGFGIDYYALGLMIAGITNLPSWVSGFVVVRTAPAKVVEAQGLAFYGMGFSNGLSGGFSKNLYHLIWDSPDAYGGYFNPSGASNLQVASSLGFFSEIYNGGQPTIGDATYPQSFSIDQIIYGRVLTDNGGINPSSVSFGSVGASVYGIQGSGVYSGQYYTSFQSWRNVSPTSLVSPNGTYPITSMQQNGTSGSSPRRNAWNIGLTNQFYNETNCGYVFNNSSTADFHEPIYVSNIVNTSAVLPNSPTQTYFSTGAYVKVNSQIGISDGSTTSYVLVDERWQDCIPALNINDPNSSDDRYIWIYINNSYQAWVNVTYKTSAQITAIQTAIHSNGFYVSTKCDGTTVNVYGMYTHTQDINNRIFTIVLNQVSSTGVAFIPANGDGIFVKYDTCAPIEVFGGDTFISEFNYLLSDCQCDNTGNYHGGDIFRHGCPMPYGHVEINESVWMVNSGYIAGIPNIKNANVIDFNYGTNETAFSRQTVINGIVESRANNILGYGSDDYNNRFASVNYVMRPLQWDKSKPHTNIHSQYFSDYTIDESQYWGYGGFRFTNSFNNDFAESPVDTEYFSKPSVGFKEQLSFCSQIIWSNVRPINEQFASQLFTFPALNVYNLDDQTGEIKRAWDSSVGNQGGNLYAFTEHGIAKLLTEKNLLTELSGQQLATMGGGDLAFIQQPVWLTRTIGMNDQMWRSAAEYNNNIWWADNSFVYKLTQDKIEFIGEKDYYSVISPILQSIGSGFSTPVTGVFNNQFNEYWLCVANPQTLINLNRFIYLVNVYSSTPSPAPSVPYIVVGQDAVIHQTTQQAVVLFTLTGVTEVFITNSYTSPIAIVYIPNNYTNYYTLAAGATIRAYYANGTWNFDTNFQNLISDLIWSESTQSWISQYKYAFDRYTSDTKGAMYGSKWGATYQLEQGYTMNGQNIGAWVLQNSSPKEAFNETKEFMRHRTNSPFKPDAVNFFNSIEDWNANNIFSSIISFKNYGAGWENYINRGIAPPFTRHQNRYSIFQIAYSQPTEWRVISSQTQYKKLV